MDRAVLQILVANRAFQREVKISNCFVGHLT